MAYEAEPLRCFACHAKELGAKEFAEHGDPAGVYFAVGRNGSN